MKKILILLTLIVFGCNNPEINNTTISTAPFKVVRLGHCYKLAVQGSLYINSSTGDTIEDHRGIVAYIPCDGDTTEGYDLRNLVIVDTVGYAKFLLQDRRNKKDEEDILRVNL